MLEDSGGTILIAGIGTYVSATDDITRNDTWNWNGTVIDDNPSSNITLSGGTHTVRCDIIDDNLNSLSPNAKTSQTLIMNGIINSSTGSVTEVLTANEQRGYIFQLMETADITSLNIKVLVADAGGLASMGMNRCIDGIPDTSYIAESTIDITTTGLKSISINKILTAGYYFCHIVTDSETAGFNTTDFDMRGTAIGWTPLRKIKFTDRDHPGPYIKKSSVISGILDASPETVLDEAPTSAKPLLFHFLRN